MWRKIITVAAIVFVLTGCSNSPGELYIPGSEAYAVKLCEPNGGLKRMYISSFDNYEHSQTTLNIYCNDNNIRSSITLEGSRTSLTTGKPQQGL